MTVTRIFLLSILFSLLVYVGLFFSTSQVNNVIINTNHQKRINLIEKKYSPIVRLETNLHGFICSAVVISESIAITAAHCVTETTYVLPLDVKFFVWDANYKKEISNVIPVSFDKLRDVAVLVGDFKEFEKMKIDFNGKYQFSLKDKDVITCGFPAGNHLFCNKISYVSNWYFQMSFTGGQLYKGMSGGPVILKDPVEGDWVIGVNSAVFMNFLLIGPIIGINTYML